MRSSLQSRPTVSPGDGGDLAGFGGASTIASAGLPPPMEIDRDKRAGPGGPGAGGAKPPALPSRLPPVAPLLSSVGPAGSRAVACDPLALGGAGHRGGSGDAKLPRLAPVLPRHAVGDLSDRRPLPGPHGLGHGRFSVPLPSAGGASVAGQSRRLPPVQPLLSVGATAAGHEAGGTGAGGRGGGPHPLMGSLPRLPASSGGGGGSTQLPPLARAGVGVGGPLLPGLSALSSLPRLYPGGVPALTVPPPGALGGAAAGAGGGMGIGLGVGVPATGGRYYTPPPRAAAPLGGVVDGPPQTGGGAPGGHPLGGAGGGSGSVGHPPALHYPASPPVVALSEHERVVSGLQEDLLVARSEIERLHGRLAELERDRLAAAARQGGPAGTGGPTGGAPPPKSDDAMADGPPVGGVAAAGGGAAGGGGGAAPSSAGAAAGTAAGTGAAAAAAGGGTPPAKGQSRYWTSEEHQRFLDAMERFGPKDVRAIATYVGSRNATQVRTHSQKYTLRLQREGKQLTLSGSRKRSMSESDLRRVGRDGVEQPGR
ncbi:hypothetical protein BU14_2550s0001, partial [Porphyra umbilicalis]